MTLAANAFMIRVSDPIVYFYEYPDTADPTYYVDGYRNFGRTGTAGFEVEYQVQMPLWWLRLSYSYQQPLKNEVVSYVSPLDEDDMVGWPSHKAVLAGGVNLLDKRLTIGPSLVFTSARTAYTGVEYDPLDSTGTTYWSVAEELDPVVLLNLHLAYAFPCGLGVSLTLHNLLDNELYLAQPYDGYHAPVSTSCRTFRLRLEYDWKAAK